MEKSISIKCEGAKSVLIEDLHPFQDDIKSMTPSVLRKLERVIIDLGFSEPIAVWGNSPDEKYWILNGHQRLTALQSLKSKGYFIFLFSFVFIYAESEDEARKKVLTLASQFGDFSASHLEEFVAKAKLDFDWAQENTRLAAGDFKWPTSAQDESNNEENNPQFILLITVENESELNSVFTEMSNRGYDCKLIT